MMNLLKIEIEIIRGKTGLLKKDSKKNKEKI